MSRRPATRRPHVVASVVYDDFSPFELAVACEVFGIDRSDLAEPWYEHRVCAAEPGLLRATGGQFAVEVPHGLDELVTADTVVVPAWREASGAGNAPPGALLDAVRRAHANGARLISVCTGAFVLAAAGLLDGRRATTHWAYAEALAERYPDIKVDPRVLYVDEGDILTSAGTAAGIDLCLHVVRLDHGAEVANALARRMVVPPHRDGGQAQYVDRPVPEVDGDPLAETLGFMLERLEEPLLVEDLARRAAMSPRHFARRFRAVTGTTPHQWLLSQRLLLAQRLLESTDEPIERVAERCGFGAANALRAHFQRALGTSPQAYRRAFRPR
jgi:transcriptional regulator GlxA family with amidase domain